MRSRKEALSFKQSSSVLVLVRGGRDGVEEFDMMMGGCEGGGVNYEWSKGE